MHGTFVILSKFRTALLLLNGLRRTGKVMLTGISWLSMRKFPWAWLSTSVILGLLSILGSLVFSASFVILRSLSCYAFSWLTLISAILQWLGLSVCSMSLVEMYETSRLESAFLQTIFIWTCDLDMASMTAEELRRNV